MELAIPDDEEANYCLHKGVSTGAARSFYRCTDDRLCVSQHRGAVQILCMCLLLVKSFGKF
jgi:hypothetical protein